MRGTLAQGEGLESSLRKIDATKLMIFLQTFILLPCYTVNSQTAYCIGCLRTKIAFGSNEIVSHCRKKYNDSVDN